MKIAFEMILFLLCLFSTFAFSLKISKKLLNIKENSVLFLSSLILNLLFIILLANFLLFFKIYNLFFFSIFTLPLLIFSYKELKEIEIKAFNLELSIFYKFLFFIFVFILFFIFFEAFITPPLSWDSLFYHMVQSASYVQEGAFVDLDFEGLLGTFKHHPKNFEIFLSIFLLPFKSDLISNLCNFYFLVITLLASFLFLKEFSISKNRILLFILNFITVPAFFVYLPTQYIEISSLSLIISGFFFLKIYEREKIFSYLFLSSIGFVLSFSFKISNFLPFFISHLFIFYSILRMKNKKILSFLIILILNIILLTHYIKISFIYKNPVYPYPLVLAGKEIGEKDKEVQNYLNYIKEKQEERFSKYSTDLNKYEEKIAPYLYTIFSMYSQNHQALGRSALLYSILGLGGLIFLKNKFWKLFFFFQILFFIFQFFSPQMEPLRILFSISYSRIFLFPVFILIFLSLTIFSKYKIYEIIFVLGFFTNIFLILPPIFLPFHLYIFFISFLFSTLFFIFFFKFPKVFVIISVSIIIISSPIIYKIKESMRLYFYLNYYHVSEISKTFIPVSTFLNGKRANIHCHFSDKYFAKDPVLYYPILGTKFENRITFINPRGKSLKEWIKDLKEAKIDLLALKGEDTLDFQFCINNPEYFKLLFEKENILIYSFNPK